MSQLSPIEVLLNYAYGSLRAQMVGMAARLRLADLLAAGPRSVADLASSVGVDPDALGRLLRALAAHGIFVRDGLGRYGNNTVSAALTSHESGSVRDLVAHLGDPFVTRGWAEFATTLVTGEKGFDKANGESFWDYLRARPEEQTTFDGAMRFLTRLTAPSVARTYPFAEVTRVCDVGGGHGTLLDEILAVHPHLAGVLFDSDEVIAAVPPAPRVEHVSGSFFERIPADCDAYIFKDILHDWDDAQALRILRVCREAMTTGNRLLVVERLVEEPVELAVSSVDLLMLMLLGGRQRTEREIGTLFEAAGLRRGRTLRAQGSCHILEAIAR